jgi:hypothetical protein
MPAYEVVAHTPTIAGNGTSHNISPLHLINIKRLAYDRGERSASVSRSETVNAVERYLARRGVPAAAPDPPILNPVKG